MIDQNLIKIIESCDYGTYYSCADYEIYDMLEDFITENYELSFSVRHSEMEFEIFFKEQLSRNILEGILNEFIVANG
jgi:hypothetical protein